MSAETKFCVKILFVERDGQAYHRFAEFSFPKEGSIRFKHGSLVSKERATQFDDRKIADDAAFLYNCIPRISSMVVVAHARVVRA